MGWAKGPTSSAAWWRRGYTVRENGRPHKARRERLEWQIREREKRLAGVEARLAAMNAAP